MLSRVIAIPLGGAVESLTWRHTVIQSASALATMVLGLAVIDEVGGLRKYKLQR